MELENQTSALDYLASFWNPEAVKKVQEMRDQREAHAFKADNEFEEHVVSGKYKDNPLLDAVKKINSLNKKQKRGLEKAAEPKSKLPTDLSSIKSTLRKFDEN